MKLSRSGLASWVCKRSKCGEQTSLLSFSVQIMGWCPHFRFIKTTGSFCFSPVGGLEVGLSSQMHPQTPKSRCSPWFSLGPTPQERLPQIRARGVFEGAFWLKGRPQGELQHVGCRFGSCCAYFFGKLPALLQDHLAGRLACWCGAWCRLFFCAG